MSEPGEVSIRRLDPAELAVVEPLWSALREHHASVSPHLGATRTREESWARRRAQYERWLSEPDAFLLIAESAESGNAPVEPGGRQVEPGGKQVEAGGTEVEAGEPGGTPVGYAMVHIRAGSPTWPSSERAGEVETLSVRPDVRGHGIGSMLLAAVADELAGLGVDELALHVISANSRAMAFYERHGLRPFAQWLSVAGIGNRRE